MDPHILTLSLGTWMSLPGYKYTTRDTAEKRAFAHNVAKYYEQYVREVGLSKYFANGTVVTRIKELQDTRETKQDSEILEAPKRVERMELDEIQKEQKSIAIKQQTGCPITNALNFLLSRGQRRLKMDRCCKRKLEAAEGKTKDETVRYNSLENDVSSDILLQKSRFKKMNLNCDKNRSVSFSCDYDSLRNTSDGSVYSTSFNREHPTFFNFLRNSCSLDSNRLFKKVPGDKDDATRVTPPCSVRETIQKKPNPRWLIEVYDVKTKTASTYTCDVLVLANGASDLPNRLAISDEKRDPSWLLHDVRSLEIELDLYLQEHGQNPDPVLIVGAGLSAADAVIATRGKNVPVLHLFRNKSRDLNKQLPENMYPEYHKVGFENTK